ncbi:MAG: type II toxin-antitoxin system RelE/ParE family toxin [Bryobacterales bacterium]|nr:type II toxin-antitoxin system RelE/ParE family toxin [Bryobacterales bacterium]
MLYYRISGPADQEIDEILTQIAADAGVEAGLGVVSDFLDLFYLLAKQPRAGRLVPEFGREIRRFPLRRVSHLLPREKDMHRSAACFSRQA